MTRYFCFALSGGVLICSLAWALPSVSAASNTAPTVENPDVPAVPSSVNLAPTPATSTPATSTPATSTVVASATATSATPTGVSLSLAESLLKARQSSPLLAGAGARIAGADARVQAAKAPPNPTLSLAQPYGSSLTGGFDEGVYLTQTIELFGKRSARTAAARADRAATALDRYGTQVDLDFQVRSAYFEALRTDAERDLARDALRTAQEFATAAQTQVQEGDAPRRDSIRAQVEVERAQTALTQAEAARANQYATLKSLVGIPDATLVQLSDTLRYVPFTLSAPEAVALDNGATAGTPSGVTVGTPSDVAQGTAQQANGEAQVQSGVQIAGLRVAARQADVRAARVASRPDAFIEGRRAKLDPSSRGTSVRVGVTLPLFDFGRNRAGVHEAQAAVQEQQFALDEARRQAQLDVRNARQTLAAAQQNVQSFQNGRLDHARELLDMTETGYREGASSYLEVLDARQVYRQEQVDYTRALADSNVALAALLHALGGGSLGNTATLAPADATMLGITAAGTAPALGVAAQSGPNSAANGSTMTGAETQSRSGAQTSGGAVLPPPSSP